VFAEHSGLSTATITGVFTILGVIWDITEHNGWYHLHIKKTTSM